MILKIYNSTEEFDSKLNTIVTIGTFDGVHIGHKKIISKIIQNSKALGKESLLLTFFPHPRMVLQDYSHIKLLNTLDEKINLLQKTGLQNLIIQKFDKKFSQLDAEEFVEQVLVNKLNIQKIIIGYDHRFGKNRTANITDLVNYGVKYDFEVEQISAQEINEVSVSSTKIRDALINGDVLLANQYLGYEYMLSGCVVKGKQLGRTLGFPTANLKIVEDYKLLPKNGVYIVKSIIDSKTVFGMMNIGNNPTFEEKELSIEIHFFDFNQNLYNANISISILDRIREEKKFESVIDLKSQLENDKEYAYLYLKQLK